MLLSKYGLETLPYNETKTDVTWETCSLRSWLNGAFYNNAFTSAEKAMIKEVQNINPDSFHPLFGAIEGGNDTKDRVFLLSEAEIEKYCNYELRECHPTNHAEQNGAHTMADGSSYWWTRTPGYDHKTAAYIEFHGYLEDREVVADFVMVRPALWLIL